jgi:hypothetical protein
MASGQCKRLFAESFEGAFPPTASGNWKLSSSVAIDLTSFNSGSKSLTFPSGFVGQFIQTPLIQNFSKLTFYYRKNTTSGSNYRLSIQTSPDTLPGATWTEIKLITLPSASAAYKKDSAFISAGLFVRIVDDRGGGSSQKMNIDDVNWESDTAFYVWKGEYNTEWFKDSNWCQNVVPNASNVDVLIPAGCPFQPDITNAISPTTNLRNLTVQPGASLRLTSGTLRIAGSISSNGAIINTNNFGTIELIGSSTQQISGSNFSGNSIQNLKISNPSGVVLAGANDTLKIGSALNFGASNCTLTTNGNLELLSTSNRTARVEDLTAKGLYSGNRIVGDVTVQRFISLRSKPKWQFMAVPTAGKSVNACWQEGNAPKGNSRPGFGTIITNSFANSTSLGFDTISRNGPSLKYFSATLSDYVGVDSTTVSIANNTGYMLFVRGDRSVVRFGQPSTVTVLRTSGQLYTPLDNPPPTINVPAGKFQSVNNFYASPIKFDSLVRTGGVQDAFYLWDPAIGDTTRGVGGFQTFIRSGSSYTVTPGGGSFGTTSDGSIQSGNAFFVKDAGTGGTIRFKETAKLQNTGTLVNRPVNDASMIRCDISYCNNGAVYLMDGVLAYFNRFYSNQVDQQDIEKFGVAEGVALLRNGKRLAAEFSNNDTLFFNTTQLRSGFYELKFSFENMQFIARCGWIYDRFLRTERKVDLDSTVQIRFEVNADPNSYASNRFFMVLSKSSVDRWGSVPISKVWRRESLKIDDFK